MLDFLGNQLQQTRSQRIGRDRHLLQILRRGIAGQEIEQVGGIMAEIVVVGEETAIGVGTVGSSEAIMLAGLAFKRKWQQKRRAQGKPCDKPNIVTGANVQVGF